jgi:hypothetical protein
MQFRLATIAVVCGVLAGCASGVQRPTAAGPGATAATAVVPPLVVTNEDRLGAVTLVFTDQGKKKASDNLKFNQDALLDQVKRALRAKELMVAEADGAPRPSLEIRIDDVRVRSNFSAVMWGFMAGADTIAGDVVVKNRAGETVDTFRVSVSYALGGVAGGQDSARMDWMYEQFAEELIGELVKVAEKHGVKRS